MGRGAAPDGDRRCGGARTGLRATGHGASRCVVEDRPVRGDDRAQVAPAGRRTSRVDRDDTVRFPGHTGDTRLRHRDHWGDRRRFAAGRSAMLAAHGARRFPLLPAHVLGDRSMSGAGRWGPTRGVRTAMDQDTKVAAEAQDAAWATAFAPRRDGEWRGTADGRHALGRRRRTQGGQPDSPSRRARTGRWPAGTRFDGLDDALYDRPARRPDVDRRASALRCLGGGRRDQGCPNHDRPLAAGDGLALPA